MADTIAQFPMLAQASNDEKPRKKKEEKPSKNKAAQILKAKQVASLTPQRRSEIASIASKARWAKKKGKDPEQPPPEKP